MIEATAHPRFGAVRANDTDYDGRVVVEMWYGDHWAVPAWAERGMAGLGGPFATLADAEAAIRAYR